MNRYSLFRNFVIHLSLFWAMNLCGQVRRAAAGKYCGYSCTLVSVYVVGDFSTDAPEWHRVRLGFNVISTEVRVLPERSGEIPRGKRILFVYAASVFPFGRLPRRALRSSQRQSKTGVRKG